jgi:hypothetical protein
MCSFALNGPAVSIRAAAPSGFKTFLSEFPTQRASGRAQLPSFPHGPLLASRRVKEKSPMNDPSTYWLTITNIALGLVTLICCVAVGIGVAQELAAKRKKKTALSRLDREVADLITSHTMGTRSTFPRSASPWPMAARS